MRWLPMMVITLLSSCAWQNALRKSATAISAATLHAQTIAEPALTLKCRQMTSRCVERCGAPVKACRGLPDCPGLRSCCPELVECKALRTRVGGAFALVHTKAAVALSIADLGNKTKRHAAYGDLVASVGSLVVILKNLGIPVQPELINFAKEVL